MLALSTHLYPRERLLAGKTLSLGGAHAPNPFRPARAGLAGRRRVGRHHGAAAGLGRAAAHPAAARWPCWTSGKTRLSALPATCCARTCGCWPACPPGWWCCCAAWWPWPGPTTSRQVWPQLRLFLHGAVAFGPYRELFRQLIPGCAHALPRNLQRLGRLLCPAGPARERRPAAAARPRHLLRVSARRPVGRPDPRPVPLAEVELGRPYALVISTNAGLWRYVVGDTVRFTSLAPYRVRITGRTKHFLNAFGEEVVIENAEAAVAAASQATGAAGARFHGRAGLVCGRQRRLARRPRVGGGVCRAAPVAPDLARFGAVLDATLCAAQLRLRRQAPPRPGPGPAAACGPCPAGTFEAWLAGQGKLGGQHKVPRLLNSREVLEAVLRAASVAARQASVANWLTIGHPFAEPNRRLMKIIWTYSRIIVVYIGFEW